MSPSPPPSPVLLNQRTVSYSVFSVIRESVSFQVCPEFIRTIIQAGSGSGSLVGKAGREAWERHSERSEMWWGRGLSLKSCLRCQWLNLWWI